MTMSNAEVSYSTRPVLEDSVCIADQAGIGGDTPASLYSTTIIYTVASGL
jgi:hypothetical protein